MAEYQDDRMSREQESLGNLMSFERAGLNEEDKQKIPKLDETNNVSYRLVERGGYRT